MPVLKATTFVRRVFTDNSFKMFRPPNVRCVSAVWMAFRTCCYDKKEKEERSVSFSCTFRVVTHNLEGGP